MFKQLKQKSKEVLGKPPSEYKEEYKIAAEKRKADKLRVKEEAKVHKDLQKMERNVKEIHRMFIDLSLLVNMQGEMIDNIEANVKCAKAAVIHAEEDLIKTKGNLSGARKVYFIIFFIYFFNLEKMLCFDYCCRNYIGDCW